MGSTAPTWDPGNGNGYFITQGFNTSCDPSAGQGYYLYGMYYCGHTGVDLASTSANAGVHATAAGIVVEAGYNGGYGVMVRIKHYLPDGSIMYSQYEHMAYGSLAVYSGQIVSAGQQLGLVGATGFATGAHLHFEIKSVNEDGWGYTFGNNSLIAGYLEPLSFVASHQLQPTTFIAGTGHGAQVWPVESEFILQHFLKSYKHYVVVSVSDGLHVRSGPGARYSVLGTALRGAKLGYISTQGTWLRVALPQNVQGWVSRAYVTGYQDWARTAVVHKGNAIWPPPGPVGTVAVVGLNVRSAPGQSHTVVTSVYQGDKVSLLSRTTNWARVLTRDGTRGWVLTKYLQEPGHPAPAQPTYLLPAVPVLHVRSGPGVQYAISGAVYSGTKLQFVRATPNWAAVILPGGTTGWVARPLTTAEQRSAVTGTKAATLTRAVMKGSTRTSPHPATATSPARASFLTVATPILNMRSGAGQSHPVVALVRQGTTLQILSLTPHWAHVALPASSLDGWVLRSLTR